MLLVVEKEASGIRLMPWTFNRDVLGILWNFSCVLHYLCLDMCSKKGCEIVARIMMGF